MKTQFRKCARRHRPRHVVTAVSDFSEHGYRGVRVKLGRRPEWRRKHGDPPYVLAFGAEIRPLA